MSHSREAADGTSSPTSCGSSHPNSARSAGVIICCVEGWSRGYESVANSFGNSLLILLAPPNSGGLP